MDKSLLWRFILGTMVGHFDLILNHSWSQQSDRMEAHWGISLGAVAIESYESALCHATVF